MILGGVLLIARPGGAGPGAWIGDAMLAGAGLLLMAFTLLVRRWEVAPLPATAAVSVLSAAAAVPASLVLGDPGRLLAIGPAALLTQVVVQGVLSGVLAILAFTAAVLHLGAARAALFPALVPAATLLIGIPVTGETPAPLDWAGMAVASLGLLIATGVARLGGRRSATRRADR